MAANYWSSTHSKYWILTKDDVAKSNSKDKNFVTETELKQLRVYFPYWISCLGQQLSLRQRVIATSITYWKRFYLKNSFVEFEPALVAGTALYLASKVEECNGHVDKIVAHFAKCPLGPQRSGQKPVQKPLYISYQVSDLIACEFYLMDALHCQLHVFHPFVNVTKYLADAGLEACLEETWKFINDSYQTELILMHHPHMITLAAMFLAAHHKEKERDLAEYFSLLNVDLMKLGEIMVDMLSIYEFWTPTLEHDVYRTLTLKLPRTNQKNKEREKD